MDGLICAWVLTCSGMLHPAERLTLQDDPEVAPLLEVVSDLHTATWRTAVPGAKLDFRMSLIAGDGNATHVHVHRAHIERADGSQVLQDARANGFTVAGLLFAGAQAEERNS